MNILKPEKKTPKNQKTRKPRLYRQALCLVSILSLIIVQAGALLLRPVPVLASEGAAAYNVAGYILSLLTSYNTAITNQQVVNSIVTTFGNMDCATASAAQIETGLATIAQSTGFDLAPIFATSAEEAAAVAAVYEGWGETAIAAASASTNIEAGAKGLALAAAGGAGAAVMPVVGGVVLPATAAVGLGIAGGFLIDHIRNSIVNYVMKGKPITTPRNEMNITPVGGTTTSAHRGTTNFFVTFTPGLYLATFGDGQYGYIRLKNTNTSAGSMKLYYANLSNGTYEYYTSYDIGARGLIGGQQGGIIYDGVPNYETENECLEYLNGKSLKNNSVSPDIVGDNGNQIGVNENGNNTVPNINPIYNYGNTYITYINPSDYQDYIDTANANTNNGDVDQPTQGVDFDTFVNPYVQPITNPDPDPNPNPNPTSVPQPTQAPIEGVNPVPNPQPTSAPLPTPSTEEQEQLPEGMTNPDWKEKFPFCIPYDILAFMQIWQEARSAPRFEFDLSFGTNGRYGLGVVVIDLAPFDSAAQLLRLLQLILFIVGLAIGTHKLLNPSGGGGD